MKNAHIKNFSIRKNKWEIAHQTKIDSFNKIELNLSFAKQIFFVMAQQHSIVGCGFYHTAVVDSEGRVWTTGNNTYGQLGHGFSRLEPEQVPDLFNIISVACGKFFTLCLDSDGNVWSFGGNGYGQLGLGDTDIRKTPNQVKISGIRSIACGEAHSICIDCSDEIWAFGLNFDGQLGLGPSGDQSNPIKIGNFSNIIQASCGAKFSVFLKSNGTVYIAGSIGNHTRNLPVLMESLREIVAVAAATEYAIALNEMGDVFVFGPSHYSQQDGPTLIENIPTIKSISCGILHSLMIDESGLVWGFGSNANFRLGFRERQQVYGPGHLGDNLPIQVVSRPKQIQIRDLKEVSFISQGGNHSIIKEDHGDIYVFGNNYKGQLGLGTNDDDVPPTKLENRLSNIIGERLRRQKSARK